MAGVRGRRKRVRATETDRRAVPFVVVRRQGVSPAVLFGEIVRAMA